jgi:hypothetical protein
MSSILIDIARRRQRPGSGSILAITPSKPAEMFHEIFSVPYALIGGQATKFYMPERTTLDWDVLVDANDLEQARSDVENGGAVAMRPLTIDGFTCRLNNAVTLDVIAESGAWVVEALTAARCAASGSQDPVLALRWLVLLKLNAGRVQDLADVSRMMGCASDQDIEATQAVISQWLADASEDLDALIQLGKLESGPRGGGEAGPHLPGCGIDPFVARGGPPC